MTHQITTEEIIESSPLKVVLALSTEGKRLNLLVDLKGFSVSYEVVVGKLATFKCGSLQEAVEVYNIN